MQTSDSRQFLLAVPRFIVYGCIGLILLLMPIYIDLEIKHVFNAAKELLFGQILCVALIAWVIDIALRGKIEVPRNKAAALFAAFIAWMALSLSWSTSFSLSIREFGTQFGCFTLFVLIMTTVRARAVIEFFVTCAITAALLSTWYGLWQYYDIDDKYFPIQQRTVTMQTPVGEVTVQPGQSLISTMLGGSQSTAIFFHRLLLPQKPEETWKDYSFMGHRNYYSGYLVLVIPLVLVRLLRKLQILMPLLLGMLGFIGRKETDSKFQTAAEKADASTTITNVRGLHPVWDFATMIFYLISLLAMINAVLLTQTRGAILGMTVSGCFMVLVSLLLANPDRRKEVLMAVFGGLSLACLPIVYLFLTKNMAVFPVIVIVCGAIFLGLLFIFRHIISRPILIVTFLCIVLGVYRTMTDNVGEGGAVRGHVDTMDRIARTANWDQSAHQRTLIYSTTLRIITDNLPTLMFGKGHGTFGIHYMHYQVQLFLDTEVSGRFLWDTNKSIYAHNEYIHFWSELGLVGITLLLMFWGFYVKRTLAGAKRMFVQDYRHDPMHLLTALAMLAGTVGTMAHCVFAFDLHLMYSMVTFYSWIPCALILAGVRWFDVPVDQNPVVARILVVLLVGLSMYLAAGLSNFYMDRSAVRIIAYGLSGLCFAAAIWLVRSQAMQPLAGAGEVIPASFDMPVYSQRYRAILVGAVCVLSFALLLRFDDLYQSNRYWRNAFAKFSMKDWKGAFEDYQKALQRDSSLGELLFDFGRAMMDSNNNPRISKDEVDKFNIATIRRNLNYRTMYESPSMPTAPKKGQPDEELRDEHLTNNFIAISSFLEATHNFTDPANFHNIALCFYKEGNAQNDPVLLRKSEEYYQKAIDLNPIYAQSLSNLGYIKALRSEWAEAKSMLERAEKLPDGQTATTFVGLALVYFHEKNYQRTLDMYRALERINPGLETALKIATLHKQIVTDELSARNSQAASGPNRLDDQALNYHLIEAENAFLRASESQEADAVTRDRVLLEAMQIRIQRLREPSSDATQAQTALPQLALAMVQMGSIKVDFPEKGRYLQQGIGILQRVIQQSPTNLDVRIALARAYELTGDLGKLREAYVNILTLMSPNHPEYSLIRRKLELLR